MTKLERTDGQLNVIRTDDLVQPTASSAKQKSKMPARKRAFLGLLMGLAIMLASEPGFAGVSNCSAGVWKNFDTGALWTLNKDGSIHCEGRCSYTRSGAKLGVPVGWMPKVRSSSYSNFTLFWSKAGQTRETCNSVGNTTMGIKGVGSFRRVK